MTDDLVIRPSSLPKWPDCPRRSAVRASPELFLERTGVRARYTPKHIGASVGTGFHAGGDALLKHKLVHGTLCTQAEARDAALASLGAELDNAETSWDEETPNKSTAEKQIERMLLRYRGDVAEHIQPVAVEQRFEGRVHGVTISGKMDSAVILPEQIRDNKTGKRRGNNVAQYGAYAGLAEANKVLNKVLTVVEDYTARVSIQKEQPPVLSIAFDAVYAKKLASFTIKEVKRQYELFDQTGDIMSFPANPSSGLCSANFCPAYGTKLCRDWLPK